MRFNDHSKLAGLHSYLSPSKPAWTNYDDEKFDRAFLTQVAAKRGTELHALAHELIRLGVKLPDSERTLNMYVNDAIGYRMSSEVVLMYSAHAFGTADTIVFRHNTLRIHDLKTGINPASFRQLYVYVALFCLEYRYDPNEIEIELRLYQNDEVRIHIPEVIDIMLIMGKMVTFNERIEQLLKEAS